MEKRRNNHNSRLLMRPIISFVLGAALAVVAHIVCPFGRAQSESEIIKPGSSLTFRIELSEKSRCQDSCVVVKAEVVNESSDKVVIDTNGLKYQIALNKLRTLRKGASSRSLTIQGDYGPGQYDETTYRVLGPGQSYSTTLSIPFSGDFFKDSGSYKLSLTYGQFRQHNFNGANLFKGTVKSNEIDFNIHSCRLEQVKKSLRGCK